MSHTDDLLARWDGANPGTVVLFGGNPRRRDHIVRLIGEQLDITVVGTLSMAEGLATIEQLHRVDVALIGGAYTDDQRIRIRAEIPTGLKTSEPGRDYPYSDLNIVDDLAEQMDCRLG